MIVKKGGEMMPLSRDDVLALLDYDKLSGVFYWRHDRNSFGGKAKAGAVAGQNNDQGYVIIGLMRRMIRAHRLAWFAKTGEWPPKGYEIDHINGKRDDNSWSNLRLVSRSQNNMNAKLRCDSASGFRGVNQRKDTGAWHARIQVNGKIILLGQFPTKEAAIIARRHAEVEHFGEYRKAS